jgi:gliding motility-associated-like protein
MNPTKYIEIDLLFVSIHEAISSHSVNMIRKINHFQCSAWLWMILFSVCTPLSIFAQGKPQIDGAAAICQGDSTVFTVSNTYKTYKWSTGDTTPSIKIKTSGAYAITVTDALNDTFKNTKTLIVNALPNANILGIPFVCNGRSTTLSILTSYPTMQWSTGSLTKETFVSQPSTVSLTVTDANNCSASSSIVIRDGSKPFNALPDSIKICEGDSAVLDATTTAAVSYYWSNDSLRADIVVRDSGQYNVIVSTGQCVSYDTVYVLTLPPPKVNLGMDTLICKGDTIRLKAEKFDLYTYKWSTGATTTSIRVADEKIYGVEVTFGNCRATDSIDIGIFNKKQGVQLDTVVCTPQYSINAVLSGAKTYLWKSGGRDSVLTVSKSNTYSVLVGNGRCTANLEYKLRFKKIPIVDLGADTLLCLETGANSLLLSAGVKDDANYIWQDDSNLPTFAVLKSGAFGVNASNECGVGFDEIKVEIKNCFSVFVPNAFSPNEDGINESFTVNASSDVKEVKSFLIFNRWGDMVFQAQNFLPDAAEKNGWNGMVGGKPLNPDVYVYVVEFVTKTGVLLTQKGDVTLMR